MTHKFGSGRGWWYPNAGATTEKLPDFANDDVASFKWLVPWVKDLDSIHLYPTIVCYENPPYNKDWRWIFNVTGIPVSREIDAKSLAEAINQFIDVNTLSVYD